MKPDIENCVHDCELCQKCYITDNELKKIQLNSIIQKDIDNISLDEVYLYLEELKYNFNVEQEECYKIALKLFERINNSKEIKHFIRYVFIINDITNIDLSDTIKPYYIMFKNILNYG